MKAILYLVAGIAIGILVAPEKGAKMRKKLMGKVDKATGHSKDSVGDAVSDLKAKGKHIGVEAENAAEKI